MLSLALALLQSGPIVARDDYGVPIVRAASWEDAFRGLGRAVAEDRLWQMETSRRTASGRMAEIVGPAALPADQETRRGGYSQAEMQAMFDALPANARAAFTAYAAGVNETIQARTAAGTLPKGYADNGVVPEPWSVLDSCAIGVMMSRLFGTGGAGELRNLALATYLQTQPCKVRFLDVFDDLGWQNDPRSPVTCRPEDDPVKDPPAFPAPSRETTERHLASLPKFNLLELARAATAAEQGEARLVAQAHAGPYKTGSYAIVVSPKRSATGHAWLLSGPQMGFTVPSVVHEAALDAPGLQVAGLNVPGLPTIAVGSTPKMAWGLTTGVADTADIVWAATDGADKYVSGGQSVPFERREELIQVKGREPVRLIVERTADGPVLLKSGGAKAVLAQRSATWMRELDGYGMILDLYSATSPADVDRQIGRASVCFNFFFAFSSGQVGWRYTGRFPVRPTGFDPRLPMPADAAWSGWLPEAQRPRLDDPKSGLIVNWNNKPVSWWPNLDTPVWGRLFRSQALHDALPQGKLGRADLEKAIWTVARKDVETQSAFLPLLTGDDSEAGRQLAAFDGWRLDGSIPAGVYTAAVRSLRKALFQRHIGNLTSDALFEQAVQPSVILSALAGETKFDYLAGRSASDVRAEAMAGAVEALTAQRGADAADWGFRAGGFASPDGPPVPYGNRGTFIQIIEMSSPTRGRSVLPPGNAEAGPHSSDQAPLARAWSMKPVWRWGGS